MATDNVFYLTPPAPRTDLPTQYASPYDAKAWQEMCEALESHHARGELDLIAEATGLSDRDRWSLETMVRTYGEIVRHVAREASSYASTIEDLQNEVEQHHHFHGVALEHEATIEQLTEERDLALMRAEQAEKIAGLDEGTAWSLSNMHEENERLEEELTAYKAELHEEKRRFSEERNRYVRLEGKYDALKNRNADLEVANVGLREQVEHAEVRHDHARSQAVESLDSRTELLTNELEHVRELTVQTAEALAMKTEECNRLETELERVKRALDGAESARMRTAVELDEVTHQLDECQGECSTEERQALERTLARVTAERDQATQAVKKIAKRFNALEKRERERTQKRAERAQSRPESTTPAPTPDRSPAPARGRALLPALVEAFTGAKLDDEFARFGRMLEARLDALEA